MSPVERPVASAAYSFVRFIGGAIAPWLAGNLAAAHAPAAERANREVAGTGAFEEPRSGGA